MAYCFDPVDLAQMRLLARLSPAQRLPESVLQEDPGLLMYYDNALMRVEKEPQQRKLS